MPKIKHSWVWVVPIWAWASAAIARAQMGTTQTQLCFILGIWARFGIIYFLIICNKEIPANIKYFVFLL